MPSQSRARIIFRLLPLVMTSACGLAQADGSKALDTFAITTKAVKPVSKDCPTGLQCYQMDLPLDHKKAKGKTIPLTFAVAPAKQLSKALCSWSLVVLVIPGYPGCAPGCRRSARSSPITMISSPSIFAAPIDRVASIARMPPMTLPSCPRAPVPRKMFAS